jgi:nitrate reductase assembly molybdenum cofactor insertion protein NarJ
MDKPLYTQLAELLEYPKEDIVKKAGDCIKSLAALNKYPPEVITQLKTFLEDLENLPLDDIQGIYSYTFELSSDYTLELGSHLYDGFKRSNQLASLKAMYREYGFPFEALAKGELPDNLYILLKFLGTLKNEELKKDLMESFVTIAVEKLNKNFEKNKRNIYCHLINSIYRVLDKDVKEAK